MHMMMRASRPGWQLHAGPRPNILFLQLVFVYLALQSFAFAFESGLLKLISGAFAFWVFGVALVNALFLVPGRFGTQQRVPIGVGLMLGFLVYYMGMGANLILLRGQNDLQEWAKIFMAPAFLLFGYVFAARDKSLVWDSSLNRLLFWLLVLLPIGVWLLQLALGRTAIAGGQVVGNFVNRNNAALYYLTLVAFFGSLTGRQVSNVLIYLLVGLMFGTLGVMLAILLALLLAVGKPRFLPHLLLAAVLGAILVLVLPDELVWLRLQRVLDTYLLLADGRINLRTVTYAELVRLLNTTDLSFIFRLKHWVDLWDIYVQGSLYQQLFGFGVGAAVKLSDMRLVPHNDYVRYLFECGLVTLIGFMTVLAVSLKAIGRNWAAVPLLGVVIYFFSENLINNFLAMVIFFFALGSTLYRSRHARETAQP
jgi:hypothetical protein